MIEQEEIGGFLIPKGLLDDLIISSRHRLLATKAVINRLIPGFEQDPLYVAMKEVVGNAEEFGLDTCDMDWYSCAMIAREIVEAIEGLGI